MISILDAGTGNLRSIEGAFTFLGVPCRIIASAREVLDSDKLVLPGVGSFRSAMEALHARELVDALHEVIVGRGVPILGICLGMQLFADEGEEDGSTPGLGWIPGRVTRFEASGLKVPHIGFNEVRFEPGAHDLCRGIGEGADFYFVHSYRFEPRDESVVCAWTPYGGRFASAIRNGSVFGTQFHPEKSQSNGLRLLSNFARLEQRIAAC